MKTLGLQLQKATVNLTCEQKNHIFDSILISDWSELEHLGVENPNFGEEGQKLYPMVKKIAAQVEGTSCEEKSQLFDNLIRGKGQTAQELIGKLDKVSNKNATKDRECEFLRQSMNDIVSEANFLGVQFPIESRAQLSPILVKWLERVEEQAKLWNCREQAKLVNGEVKS